MLLRSVFGKAVFDHRRGLLGWGIGIAAFVALYISFYPSYSTPEMAQSLESFPEGVLDAFGMTALTSPEGYLQSTVFGMMAPLLFLIFAAGRVGRALTGEEEDGALDLVLAHPVTRTRLLLERFGAVAAELLALGLIVFLLIAVIAPFVEMDAVGVGDVAAAVVGLVLLGVCFAALATATGGLTGSRAAVLGMTAAVGVLGYIADTIAPRITAIDWTQRLSPFYYASGNDPLNHGLHLGHMGILLVITAVLLGLAVWGFNRRDVAV